MILEKLNKKVNPKKIIYLFSWILEVDKSARQPWVHGSGGWIEGERVREKGVGEEWRKLG